MRQKFQQCNEKETGLPDGFKQKFPPRPKKNFEKRTFSEKTPK